jgi:WD40 repeat protein
MKTDPVLAVGGNLYGTNPAPVVEMWNISTGKRMFTLPSHDSGYPAVSSVAFTPDESTLVSAGTGPIECWSRSTGKLIRTIQANGTPVRDIAISPDGQTLATAENTSNFDFGTVLELWNLSTGAQISSLPSAARQNNGVAFSPDGTKLVSCGFSYDGLSNTYTDELEVWSVAGRKLLNTLESQTGVVLNSVAFSPDGSTLVDAGYSGADTFSNASFIETWNVASGTKTNTLGGLGSQILTTAFSPDSKTLVTGGLPLGGYNQDAPDVCELWNVGVGSLLTNLITATYSYLAPSSFAYSPDSKTIAHGAAGAQYSNVTATNGGIVMLRNAATGALTATLNSSANEGVGAVAYSPNGLILADGGSNYTVKNGQYAGVLEFWNPATNKLIASLASQCDNGINQLVFSADGSMLAAAGSLYDPQIGENIAVLELWNVPKQKVTGYAIGHVNLQISGVAFTSDNKTMVVGGTNFVKNGNPVVALEIWNLTTGKVAFELTTSLTSIGSAALSHDGKTFVASGSIGNTPTTEFWDVASGKLKTTLADGGTGLQFSADGSVLWMGSNGLAKAYGSNSNVLLGSYAVESTSTNQFLASRDAKSLAYLSYAPGIGLIPNPLYGEGVSGFTLSATSVLGSTSSVATVTLALPAPVGGTAVYIGSNSPNVPAVTIHIPAGKTTGTATIATLPVSVATIVDLTAQNVGASKTVALTVNPAALATLQLSVPSVVGGSSTAVSGLVTMTGPAPVGGYKVSITSSSAIAKVPASVTIPAGSNHVSFPITTSAVKSSTAVTIYAICKGVTQTAKLTVTP